MYGRQIAHQTFINNMATHSHIGWIDSDHDCLHPFTVCNFKAVRHSGLCGYRQRENGDAERLGCRAYMLLKYCVRRACRRTQVGDSA
jgi:hypothetical protein